MRQDNFIARLGATHKFRQLPFGLGDRYAHAMSPQADMASSLMQLNHLMFRSISSALTRRRKHLADWRKLNLAQYQEFVLALSRIVEGRQTNEANLRFADAVNSMRLIASTPVLHAMEGFLKENSYLNTHRNPAEHDRLLNELFHVMRTDIHPRGRRDHPKLTLGLITAPPEIKPTSK